VLATQGRSKQLSLRWVTVSTNNQPSDNSGDNVSIGNTAAKQVVSVAAAIENSSGGSININCKGLFLTSLTGPGRMWLQSMPPDCMIAEIARRMLTGVGGGGGTTDDAGGTATPDGTGTGTEAVVAGDATVEVDRAATVASSECQAMPLPKMRQQQQPPVHQCHHLRHTEMTIAVQSFPLCTPKPSFSDDPFSTENNPNQDALMDDSEFTANNDNDEFF